MAALLLLVVATCTVSSAHSNSHCGGEGHDECFDPPAHKVNMLLQLGTATSSRLENLFHSFMKSYDRKYAKGSDEYHQRILHFRDHVDRAEHVNKDPASLWTAAAGPLWDFSPEERAAVRGWSGGAQRGRSQGKAAVLLNQMSLPESFSWADNLTSLKKAASLNQGACGSCWATATTKVLSAHAEIHDSPQKSFSTQELVDCVPNPASCGGTGGCEGATTELALQYVMEYGLSAEKEAAYLGIDQSCSVSLTDEDKNSFADEGIRKEGMHTASESAPGRAIGMTGFERLPENQYGPLLHALYEKGPVAVSVDASMWSLYSSGIFNSCTKDAEINHAVILVGWGHNSKNKFWTIQNSWGDDWGEKGLMKLLRHDSDDAWCGTDYQPLDGTGCTGGPSSVAVCGMCGIHYDSALPHFSKM